MLPSGEDCQVDDKSEDRELPERPETVESRKHSAKRPDQMPTNRQRDNKHDGGKPERGKNSLMQLKHAYILQNEIHREFTVKMIFR